MVSVKCRKECLPFNELLSINTRSTVRIITNNNEIISFPVNHS